MQVLIHNGHVMASMWRLYDLCIFKVAELITDELLVQSYIHNAVLFMDGTKFEVKCNGHSITDSWGAL